MKNLNTHIKEKADKARSRYIKFEDEYNKVINNVHDNDKEKYKKLKSHFYTFWEAGNR